MKTHIAWNGNRTNKYLFPDLNINKSAKNDLIIKAIKQN